MIVFDIETGPLDTAQLSEIVGDFTPPPAPGEFDPASVKLGNLKDETKIAEKVAAAKAAHADACKRYAADVDAARLQWWKDVVSEAALSPLTGRVLAIGYLGKLVRIDAFSDEMSEADLLSEFWTLFDKVRQQGRKLVGHNIVGFDIPFLVRRSWLLGVPVPLAVFSGRYVNDKVFADTMTTWQCGNHRDKFVSLDKLGRAMGVGGKADGCTGADFSRMFFGTEEERRLALDYLRRDLELTQAVAQRIGIL